MDKKILDTIRQGIVSSVNYEEGRVRVMYPDKNEAVTQELPLQSFEYDMPAVGDLVYVAHQSNSIENGLVLGRYWHDGNIPAEFGSHIWIKELGEGCFLKYDRKEKTFTLKAKKIVLDGDVAVTGSQS